jgi:hypothetical protein
LTPVRRRNAASLRVFIFSYPIKNLLIKYALIP